MNGWNPVKAKHPGDSEASLKSVSLFKIVWQALVLAKQFLITNLPKAN